MFFTSYERVKKQLQQLSAIVTLLFVSLSVAISQPETSTGCRVGHEFLYPGNVTVFNLGSPLNSEYSEYNAVISKDESYMLFTSRSDSTTGEKIYKVDLKPYEDMMISSMKNRTFESAVNLEVRADLFPFNINTSKHEAPVFLGKNDSLLIIYKEDKLWFSTLTDTGYTQAKLYPNEINKGDFQPHGSITEDDSVIYFSSEVVDKKNNYRVHLDIFMSKRNKDGGWSKPEALPEPINSLYNEDSPNVCYGGSSLFFASDRPSGFGGYDVYFTEVIDGAWSGPELLCEPINSGAHDIYFTLTSSNRYAFFSSNRLGGLGNMDIYKVVLNPTEFGDCVDQKKSAHVENDSAMYNGLIIEGRDITGVGVLPSSAHSTMSKKNQTTFGTLRDIRKEGARSWDIASMNPHHTTTQGESIFES
ncbi:MAG: hypothetical protein R2813_13860 [Flavobacteriales bacterium]